MPRGCARNSTITIRTLCRWPGRITGNGFRRRMHRGIGAAHPHRTPPERACAQIRSTQASQCAACATRDSTLNTCRRRSPGCWISPTVPPSRRRATFSRPEAHGTTEFTSPPECISTMSRTARCRQLFRPHRPHCGLPLPPAYSLAGASTRNTRIYRCSHRLPATGACFRSGPTMRWALRNSG